MHVGGDADETLAALAPGRDGLAERPFLLFGQQSVADPTRAPAGKHTAWAYTHGPHDADWAGRADALVERIEAQVERFAPGFRDRILARHVLAPGRPGAAQREPRARRRRRRLLRARPARVPPGRRACRPYRTPVRGLYLGSASTFPGGSVHGVPGHAAARTALVEERVRRLVPGG